MLYVVRCETSRSMGPIAVFYSYREAWEQMERWAKMDRFPDADLCNPDWGIYIVTVPEENVTDCLDGYAETERFQQGIRGNSYLGSYYWLCSLN